MFSAQVSIVWPPAATRIILSSWLWSKYPSIASLVLEQPTPAIAVPNDGTVGEVVVVINVVDVDVDGSGIVVVVVVTGGSVV